MIVETFYRIFLEFSTILLSILTLKNCKKLIQYLLVLIISIISTITLICTKIVLFHSKLTTNICGVDCGYLSFRFDKTVSFEYVLFEIIKNNNSQFIWILHFGIFLIVFLFRISSLFFSLYAKGIAIFTFNLISYSEIIKDNLKTFIFLFFAFWGNIILIYDLTYVAPDYVRFYDLSSRCDFLQIDSPECGVSFYGLFYIKLSLNFIGAIYVDLFATCVFVITSTVWLYILVGNSIKNFFSHNFAQDVDTANNREYARARISE